MLADHL